MKSFAARLSVVVLALTGFTAATVCSKADSKKHDIKPIVLGTNTPAPMCPPWQNPNPCRDSMD